MTTANSIAKEDGRHTGLLLSLPGSSDFKTYVYDSSADLHFNFVSFDGRSHLVLPMSEGQAAFHWHYNPPQSYPEVSSKEAYLKLVREAVAHIRAENLGKIVTSRSALFNKRLDPETLFHQVRQRYPQACVYLFSHPAAGTWLGATPETLLKKETNHLETMSLAGTRLKGEEASFTAKERYEQQLVTDYIKGLFEAAVGIREVKVGEPLLSEAANLVHFRTPISAEIGVGFDPCRFIAALHPTPAVAGLPLKEALLFLSERENYQRSFYSGYFGLRQAGDFHYFVNLRCMQIFEDKIALYAGGGITADSDPQAEWEETEAKMRTLLNVIEAASETDRW